MNDSSGPQPQGSLSDVIERNAALLHEVDHRVKNNLQLIASLLALQCRRTADPTVREALGAILGRVNAVAVVHRRMSHDGPVSFDVGGFLDDLVEDLGGETIRLNIDADSAQAPTSSAAPLALAVNELLSNAMKHAFPDDRTGWIDITLTRDDEGMRIEIADDGVGIAADHVDGFGLGIVRLLCRQLKAEFEMIAANPGTRAILSLPDRAS